MQVIIDSKSAARQELPLGVSELELSNWRREFGEVVFIRIRVPRSGVVGGFFRAPSFDIIKLVQDVAKSSGDLDAMEQLYVNCRLKVSEEVDKDVKLKLSLFKQLGVLLDTYEAEVVKY